MTKIEGEFGTISKIQCSVGVPTIAYEEGGVPVGINTNKHFNRGYPENCPRVTDSSFDAEKELGCLVCSGSVIEFSEAELSLTNRTGEVLPLSV